MVVGARRIRSERLREHQCRGGYARPLEGKGIKWYEDDNVEHMWEQVKWTMEERARLSVWLCESGRKELKKCVVEQ